MRGWVHHIDLTVSDLGPSGPFYDAVLSFLGYCQSRKGETWIDWDMGAQHCPSSVGIRVARDDRSHNRYPADFIKGPAS
jgi:glyoxylase I family protein